MSEFSETTASSQKVRAAATQRDELPSGTVLIGTVTAKNSAHALVRSTRGKIHRVTPGDRIGQQTVAAIEQGSVILMQSGRTERLVIPGS